MEKIYLPNDDNSLKQYSIHYNRDAVIQYINQKSIELGAKVEGGYSCHPSLYGRSVDVGERITQIGVWHSGVRKHSYGSGFTKGSHIKICYKIFSNEQPIIGDLLSAIESKNDCLGKFREDKDVVLRYLQELFYDDETNLNTFFDSYDNSVPMLSFETLVKHLKNEDDIKIFLEFFHLKNEEIVDYGTIEKIILKGINLAVEAFPSYFEGTIKIAKEQLLEHTKQKFDETSDLATKTQKVLKLKFDV